MVEERVAVVGQDANSAYLEFWEGERPASHPSMQAWLEVVLAAAMSDGQLGRWPFPSR